MAIFDERIDPDLAEVRAEHPEPSRTGFAPERPGDKSRPSVYLTSASLCHQTCIELRQYSEAMKIVHVGGDPKVARGQYICRSDFPPPDDAIWNTNNPDAIRTVFVLSYNIAAKHYGPQAYWNQVKLDMSRYCKERHYNYSTFDFHKHMADPLSLPDRLETSATQWVRSFSGQFGLLFADECQDGLRNPSSYWRTVGWMNARSLVLMSGYPAPRGMEDFGSYIRLMERDELRQEEDKLRKQNEQDKKEGKSVKFTPGISNPYILPPTDAK